ncbi:MAG: hypothetical protein R3F50_18760 [Gammaproteobacteria bacterium]
MNIEKFNQLLSLLANLGVLAGIVFLAIELQQNTDMMEAQTRDSITDKQLDWSLAIASDTSIAALWEKGNSEIEFTEPGEGAAYFLLTTSSFRIWENEFYQYQKGLFSESEFLGRENRWRNNMRNRFRQGVWCNTRSTYSEGFQEIMNSFLTDDFFCEENTN